MGTGIPLADAALRTGLTYHQVRQKLLQGDLKGGRDGFGRFYIDPEDLERWCEERQKDPPIRRPGGRRGRPRLSPRQD